MWASVTQHGQPKGVKRDYTTGTVPINVTLKGVPVTIAAAGEQEVLLYTNLIVAPCIS